LAYDPDSGLFIRKAPLKGQKVGAVSGVLNKLGYIQVGVDRKIYFGHRLAWFYVHGRWPEGQIDHINGIRSDNRICNLRDADWSINNQNQIKPHKDNACGLLGVCRAKKRWRAAIKSNGKIKHLGTFDTPELAHEAYLAAKRQVHPGCTI